MFSIGRERKSKSVSIQAKVAFAAQDAGIYSPGKQLQVRMGRKPRKSRHKMVKEDYFYCIMNAIRLGGAVPNPPAV